MKVPLHWLRSYVRVDAPPTELAHKLTLAGLETSSVDTIGDKWGNIFVGHVLSVTQHPNADRLVLCDVDLGTDQFKVVCGAPNVRPGQRIAFARVGANLTHPDTGQLQELKAARIRGEMSHGMICSERELGLGNDHTGIRVLAEDAPIGTPLADYLGDSILDMEPTTNRPDWLSILGVAREVAAVTGVGLHEPVIDYPEKGPVIESKISIFVDAPELAPRYTASLILGVTIGPSPQWMQERLTRAGQRPINNLVDITNYVMLEYGQPLHAFDYDKLTSGTIHVRRATSNEVLVTLDGQPRRLSSDTLIIADGHGPIGLAGVMGGANSEMTDSTSNVLLEAANFDPVNIRSTGAFLRHRTDASTRFERGLNPELTPIALRRATQLIIEIAGGEAAQGIIDLYPGKQQPTPVDLTLTRIEKVLGITFSIEETLQILSALGFVANQRDRESLSVSVPYWRSDIHIEDDLVEELARIKGYDSIPITFLSQTIPPHQPNPIRNLREGMTDLLVAAGMQETISYTATSLEALQGVLGINNSITPLKIANPVSQKADDFRSSNIRDTLQYREYMRTTLRAGILESVGTNQRFSGSGLKLFEIGRVYLPRPDDLPDEREMVVGALWGDRNALSWAETSGKIDFFDAKGVIEAALNHLQAEPEFSVVEDPFLVPGRAASVSLAGQVVGLVGEIKSSILDSFDVTGDVVAFFELDLNTLLVALPHEGPIFEPLPRYPSSFRDITLTVDVRVPSGHLEEIIKEHTLVESVTLFDVYIGDGIPEGRRSLTYRVHYQSVSETLTAQAVNVVHSQILKDLERETGARLRV